MRADRRPLLALFCIPLIVMAGAPVLAQVARSGGGQNAAVQQLQQLAQERTALQAENARLKKDLDKATADLKAAQGERDALKKKIGGAESAATQAHAACSTSEDALKQKQTRMDELVARFRETATTLREVESGRAQAQQQLAEKGRALDACAVANSGLYDVASEALTRYESSAVRHTDPFTRVSRNRLENLVDDYRDRARELKLPAPKATAQ